MGAMSMVNEIGHVDWYGTEYVWNSHQDLEWLEWQGGSSLR